MRNLVACAVAIGVGMLAVSTNAAAPEPWVLEADREWLVAADFDGDGLSEVTIVDRVSGQYRVGWQKAPDNVGWADAQLTGVTDVEGVAAGRLIDLNHDSLAFTSPALNRVQVLTPDSATTVSSQPVHTLAFGPGQVVALDVVGTGNTAHDDLLVEARLMGPPNPSFLESVRSSGGGTFAILNDGIQSESRFRDLQRMQLRDGDPSVAIALHRMGGSSNDLFAWDHQFNPPSPVVAGQAGTTLNSRLVGGRFSNRPLATLLVYEPGQDFAAVWRLNENGASDFILSHLFDLGFPADAGRLALLPDPSGNRLLFIAADGSQAIVYQFNEDPNPEVLEVITQEGGLPFTGILPLGDGHFVMLSGVNGVSTQFQTWLQNGDGYEAGPSGSLPSLDSNANRATILEFRSEPLVVEQAGMTRSIAVGDWSNTAMLAGAPLQLSSTIEAFAGASGGLDNPMLKSIGPAHPDSTFALPNQYRSDISFFQLFAARGDEVVDVSVVPGGGSFAQAVQVTLSAVPDTVVIGYRLGEQDNWAAFPGTPINIFTNTTLQFFAINGANEKSPIRSETYTFTSGPDDLDSDGDGVPDYVELAEGLDPANSGNDGDGDGFFDRDELITGTDPLDPGSFPGVGHERLEDLNLIDLHVTPEPYDGAQAVRTTSLVGSNVRAFDTSGSLLSAGTTFNMGMAGVPDPVAQLQPGVQPELPWFTAITDPHFELVTVDPDRNRGRELLRVIPMPENDALPAVAHAFDPAASLSVNANAWIGEVQGLYAARDRLTLNRTLREDDTLIGLLLEHQLARIFLERGGDWATNLTLFPQRLADAGRRAPTLLELRGLERRVSPALPGYRLVTLLEHFESSVKSGAGANLDQLRLLTREVYRISSALHNDDPGTYASPITVIREFLGSGILDVNYAAQTTLSPADLVAAFTSVNDLFDGAPTRPYQTVQLVVRPDSFSGECTLMDTLNGLATWSLFHANGEAYGALETFDLLPGAEVQVSGYTDAGLGGCGFSGIEIDTIRLQLVPAASTYDLNGNLLIDSWEQVFFGGTVNPFDDDDGDLFTNVQEMFEGSDPNDALGQPGVPVAALAPPVLQIEIQPNNGVRLTWMWPLAYANQIQVQMLSKPTLSDPFDTTPLTPIHIGGDEFEVVVADPGTAAYFFQFALKLND